MTAVLLALLTALCWGWANYLSPLLTRRHPLGGVLVVSHVVAVFGAAALLLVSGGSSPDGRLLLFGLAAGVCNALAAATLYPAAAAGPISIVAPINSTGAALPVIIALAAGERPTALQSVGIPLAVVGTVLVAARVTGRMHTATPRTIALAAASAVAFGGFLVCLAAASDDGSMWGLFITRSVALACTAGFVAGRGVAWRVPGRQLTALALPGVLLLVGTASYAAATSIGLVSVVAVLATLAPVVTVTLAVALLRERLAMRQLLGVLTATGGVVLLTAG